MALRDHPIAAQSAVPTASATVGPFFPAHFIGATDHDLTRRHPQGAQAQGNMIYVTGRVFEAARVPRWNTIIEMCQADAQGIYAHPADPRHAQADPHFMGWGRCATDQTGAFSFLTVMPSGYVDPLTQAKRAPHLELSVSGSGLMRRLRTTLFFADLVDKYTRSCLDSGATSAPRRVVVAFGGTDCTGPVLDDRSGLARRK